MASKFLGDVAEIVMGQSPSGETCNTEGHGLPLLNGPTEFGPHHPWPVQFTTDPRRRALPGDLLFCVRGSTTGRMNWADREYAIGRGVAVIRHRQDRYLQPFLRAVVEYDLPRLLAEATGSTFPNVSAEQLADLPYPPFDDNEQHAIAHILGTLDDKIELNRCMNETLEAIARAIFKSWFVDFDPVRAKAEGRQPPAMDAETAALFPDCFRDSPLGKVPQGWKVAAIGEIVKVAGGSTPSTKEPTFWGGTINFATPKDLSSLSTSVLLDTERCITDAGLQHIGSGLLPSGAVLLSSRAPIGYLAIAATPIAVNQGIIAMVCDGDLPNYYVLQWARENLEAIRAVANGTTFLEVSKRNFRPINVVVPPVPILARFVRVTVPLHQRVLSNLVESRTLATTRDTLLPKLLSGEIRVREAEKAVERVV